MTSVPTNLPFVCKTMPTYPGAYLVNKDSGAHPIFCSIDDFNTWGFNNQDDYYIVMPGYLLQIYIDSGKTGTIYTYENRGSVVKYFNSSSQNTASSCRLFFLKSISGSTYTYTEISVSGIS
jgi:hypothetical protein